MSLEHDPIRDGDGDGDGDGPLFLTPQELAARWRVSPRSLERWRSEGGGPRWLRLKGGVLYAMADVRAYERARMRNATG